jgi:hypothetical protein
VPDLIKFFVLSPPGPGRKAKAQSLTTIQLTLTARCDIGLFINEKEEVVLGKIFNSGNDLAGTEESYGREGNGHHSFRDKRE